jgi:hypothetical protein
MYNDFVDDLIHAVNRVVTPNIPLLKDVLVIGGMPEKTQNLKYLSYNRNVTISKGRSCEFSAVAVLNNHRIERWRLTGYSKKVSGWVFSTRWTRNPLDLFMNRMRCDASMMAVLSQATSPYTLLGILNMTNLVGNGEKNQPAQYIRPVVALPNADADELKTIQAFEAENQIQKSGLIGLEFYRKSGKQMAEV